mmetsp:Transcript_21203/g.27373  ORF Transcript_21203/g.27373 Transcript_21203/m.27373 type:complete len:310 (-) Transcript_21203:267-1196(-)
MGRKTDAIAFVMSFVILLIGAAIYTAIEKPNEIELAEKFIDEEDVFKEVVRDVTVKYNESFDDVWSLLTNYSDAAASATDPDSPNWGTPGAAFFCFTIMTTIGYGTFAPQTDGGKAFLIFYVMLSVPAFLFALASVSSNLVEIGRFFEGKFVKYDPDEEVSEEEQEARDRKSRTIKMIGIPSFMLIMMLFFSIGVNYVFGWSYLDSLYYNVITLTTVGLGDLAPTPEGNPEAMCVFGFYALIGLASLACLIENVQEIVVAAASKAAKNDEKKSRFDDQAWKDRQTKKGWEVSHLQQLHGRADVERATQK